MPRTAILGWGSLLWDRRGLQIKEPWNRDGPKLPIEFARTSGLNARQKNPPPPYLSLVVYPNAEKIVTYWTLSLLTDLASARENLKETEGCPLAKIAFLPSNQAWSRVAGVDDTIRDWLAGKSNEVGAVLWTNLEWKLEDRTQFTSQDAISWIDTELRKKGRDWRAEEYVRKAPSQTDTPVRRMLRTQFGWTDINIGY